MPSFPTVIRNPKVLLLAVSLVVMAAYLSVLPSRLSDANYGVDGGDFLAAMLTGGIPHPTGYPTYTLLGWAIQQLPVSNPYSRALVLSWLPAALAAGLLAFWVRTRALSPNTRGGWLAAILAGLAWGLGSILWSQAVIVEVHGLQSLFIVITLWWVTELIGWNPAAPPRRRLLLLAWLVGLGLGNHITLVLMGPACLFALWYAWRRGMPLCWGLMQAGMTLLGVLVYLYLPLRASQYPPINWGNPQNWEGFWWLVSGKPYQGLLFTVSTMRFAERITALASLLREQFGVLGLVAAVIGAMQFEFRLRPLRWVLVWMLAIYSLFSIGYATDDSTAYLVPVSLVASAWLGLAVVVLWDITYRKAPVGVGLAALLAFSLAWQLPATHQRVDARTSTRPADFAEMALETAPQNAIILTTFEYDSFPLWYYHFGLGQRPDIAVVVLPMTQFVWYQQTVTHTYPEMSLPPVTARDTASQRWGEQIPALNPDRPVCKSIKDATSPYWVNFTCQTR